MHDVAGGAQPFGEGPNAGGQSLGVVEQHEIGHGNAS
jgi:hypothetical protein